ncbi:MAG: hypothetical protein IH600_18590 [Bacteroidetes bacterium]|nr:hypothetical protein [Bacteroidota bacterium]
MIRVATMFFIALMLLTSCGGKQLSIEEFQSMAKEAEQQSNSIAAQQEEMRGLLQAYDQTVPAERRLRFDLEPECGLSSAAYEKLSARIDDESDPSCLGLLEQIAEIQEDIRNKCERLHEITAQLPAPHRVQPGENHYSLCLKYLTAKHHLSAKTADSLVARVGLSSDIIEGFHVWFYYQDGIFGTFVTQGEAHVSPTVFAKVVKQHLLEQARRQGHDEAFETILDSLKRSGALLANIKHSATGR